MSKMCRINPMVRRMEGTKVIEKDSQLFKDAYKATKDRESAKMLWGYTKTKNFELRFPNIERDDMGEVKFTSLISNLNLTEYIESLKDSKDLQEDFGITKNGKKVSMTVNNAVSIMNKFNKRSDTEVAIPVKGETGYTLDVVRREGENLDKAKRVSFNSELNSNLLNIMREAGFDVREVTGEDFDGLFDPTQGKFENGLLTVIQIAKGERGQNALPEEFAHFIVEGLKNTNLGKRLLNSITLEMAREILGEEFEEYARRYNNNAEMIIKEAAGKMLADRLIHGTKRSPLVDRLWNSAKQNLNKITQEQLMEAYEKASQAVDEIYNKIQDKSVVKLISKEDVLSGGPLYKIDIQRKYLRDDAYNAKQLTAKRIELKKIREGRDHLTLDETSTLLLMEEQYQLAIDSDQEDSAAFTDCIISCIDDVIQEINSINKEIQKLLNGNMNVTGVTDITKLNQTAKLIRRIIELRDGYQEALTTFKYYDDVHDMSSTFHIIRLNAKAISRKADEALRDLHHLQTIQSNLQVNVLYAWYRTIYGPDRVLGLSTLDFAQGVNPENQDARQLAMLLQYLIERSNRDVTLCDSWFTSIADCDDPLLSLTKSAVDAKKYERDQMFADIQTSIAVADRALRQAGYSSAFIHERDSEGKLTGRLISEYDFDSYIKERENMRKSLNEHFKDDDDRAKKVAQGMRNWENSTVEVNGVAEPRFVYIALDPDQQSDIDRHRGNEDLIKADPKKIRYERMPNPKVYSKNANVIKNLSEPQRVYYEKMIRYKRKMMSLIPTGSYKIYQAIYISRQGIDGIMANVQSGKGIVKSVLDNIKQNFIRRPDEIDWDRVTPHMEEIMNDIIGKAILKDITDDADKLKLLQEISNALSGSTNTQVILKKLENVFKNNGLRDTKVAEYTDKIMTVLDEYQNMNTYILTDFSDIAIEVLPTNYMERLKDPQMMSLDFSGNLNAFSAMAINYSKMNEIIDLLELTRHHIKYGRPIHQNVGSKTILNFWKICGQEYRNKAVLLGKDTKTGRIIDNYFANAVYGRGKEDMGEMTIFKDYQLNRRKVIDSLKNFTGVMGLGLNFFCGISNLLVGKIQMWIESCGNEFFGPGDYIKATLQYKQMMPALLWESVQGRIDNESKLGLLIQKLDPAANYFEEHKHSKFYQHAMQRLIGNNSLGMIGMTAGEHVLRSQTMLAILNHDKVLVGQDGKEISLFDAFQTYQDDEGITRIKLRDNLYYKVDEIGPDGKVVLDDNGKPLLKLEPFTDKSLNDLRAKIKAVGDTMHGAFSQDDMAYIGRYWWGSMIMQFRRWMPAHYNRRFSKAHYNADLKMMREGYYNTMWKVTTKLAKSLWDAKTNTLTVLKSLTPHEKANLRRAVAEIGIDILLSFLCDTMGGGVKLKDRSKWQRLVYYQLLRLKLEVGASDPFNSYFFKNAFTIVKQPAAMVGTLELVADLLDFQSLSYEIQSGKYAGMTRFEKMLRTRIPYLSKIIKFYEQDSGATEYLERAMNKSPQRT